MDTHNNNEVENQGPARTTGGRRMCILNAPRHQATQEMARGLRDAQIMVDPLARRQRQQRREFEREIMELFNRISSSSQPVKREPGSHRLLHRRNNTPNLQKKPSKLTFMRI
ncbi:hypothetical protein KR038_011747 [Drosophila bunnanda]|nr:hypothetical protein KR038_011747 [Drosophila bunnanda]